VLSNGIKTTFNLQAAGISADEHVDMSASLAGKFQDHYDVLGVDPKADSETIQQAYSALAQKFHPNNGSQGNKEKFDAVNQAYETLADPLLRREFDKVKGVGQDEGNPTFSGREFFDALGRETSLRAALLCVLYDRRRTNPFRPSLSMRQIENMLDWTSDQLAFTLWYLKQRNMVRSDDKSSLQITVEGMDFLETNRPSPEAVMPFVKGRG
jgi:curved DNA-binding protein CbpA